jgi:hypothetical protein
MEDAVRSSTQSGVESRLSSRRVHGAVWAHGKTAGSILLLIAIFFVLVGMRSADIGVGAECRSDPVALTLGTNVEPAMTVQGGAACALLVKATASIENLELTTLPRHGVVTARGRTGVVYQPERKFTGRDSFAFTLRGASSPDGGTSVARVAVTVK